ncbi:cytochrome P450 [Stachybotrys elegans]|uniref:Cytochrome P450 n=1 Tax=Stachybotrys elegans TaxID=80388 RepID=A0A8K0WM10_9HYPO|nr:cytochrome P450 [Stachybotrys elegans]
MLLSVAIESPVETAVHVSSALICIYIISLTFYNLLFHPLSKFPGPVHYRASILPWAYRTLRGDLSIKLLQLHEKYGTVVRISPSELSFSDHAAWRDVYGSAETAKHHKFYSALSFGGLLPQIIIDAENGPHKILKGFMTDGLSDRSARRQEKLLLSHLDAMLVQINRELKREGKSNGPNTGHEGLVLDLNEWFTWLIFDMVGDLVLGESFGCVQHRRKTPLIKVLTEVTEAGSLVVVLWHVGLKFLVTGLQYLAGGKFLQVLDETKTRLVSRMTTKIGRDDLIEPIIRAEQEGKLSFDHLLGTTTTLLIAGTDTTKSGLLSFLYHITSSPDCLEKLTDEIRSAFASEADICLLRLEELKYLNICIKEFLRIHPPAPMGFPRVAGKGGRVISGIPVPENTVMSVDGYCITHLERNFHKPYEFHPERFLGVDEFKNDTLQASQPFSLGPHSCPGRSFGLAIMRLTIAKMIWNFDLETCPLSRQWTLKQKIYVLWKPKPLFIRVNPLASK